MGLKEYVSPNKGPIAAHAPTQHPFGQGPPKGMTEKGMVAAGRQPYAFPFGGDAEKAQVSFFDDADEQPKKKKSLFDKITKAAGSNWVMVGMFVIIGAWLVWGFVDGTDDTWQILWQNASSIQVYITDILLLRQQSNGLRSLLKTLAEVQSRNMTVERLIQNVPKDELQGQRPDTPPQYVTRTGTAIGAPNGDEDILLNMQKPSKIQYVWSKTCKVVANCLGSLYAFIIYWIGIGVWVAAGPSLQFSDTWQLYVNTATALALTFTSVFLQNIQQQQEDNLEASLHQALKIDAEIERNLREIADDGMPNPVVEILPSKLSKTAKCVDFFADMMGSGIGVTITLLVFIAWIAVGPVLQFDDNWWLIIGTFTGLVGFIDGFVLRNVYGREAKTVNSEFRAISAADSKIFELLNAPMPKELPSKPESVSMRVSRWAGDVCATNVASIGSVCVVFTLIGIASIMRWSETGQLLCNTPTMIVEGFLLLILIQAHNLANMARGREFTGMLRRRLALNAYVRSIQPDHISIVEKEEKTAARL